MRQLESAPVKQIFCWIAKVNSIKPPWQGWWHSRACMETKEKIRQGRSSHWLELVNGQGQGGEQEEIECMDFVTFTFIWTFVYRVFHFGSKTTWHPNQQNYFSYPELEEDQRFDQNMSLNIANEYLISIWQILNHINNHTTTYIIFFYLVWSMVDQHFRQLFFYKIHWLST